MDNNIKTQINKVKNRILFLSPSVKEGLEKECAREDFFSEGEKAIGKGGFGQVWKVRHKQTDKVYVIKVMSKQNIIEQRMVDQINREIEIMYKLNHPHIIRLFNHFEDDENLYLIMHFASKGQLYSLLKKQSRFDQRTTAQYMREVISAVKYLHSFDPPIIHRDIKPENILLDENGRCNLADFGWSNYVDQNNNLRKTYCGTPEYLAPEMIKKEGHDTSIDIWDLGVLMFELLSGKPPFAGTNQGELFTNIKKHKINWPDDFPPLAKNLISKILKQNPKERLSLDEILNHSWFEKNSLLRQVLKPQQMDERQWLEFHMITAKNEHTKDEINTLLNSKRKSILEIIRKINLTNSNNILTKGAFNNIDKPIPDEIDLYKPKIAALTETIEKLKKENNEGKQKNDKGELEIKTLKNELTKIKDPNTKSQEELKLQVLQEELDNYKIMNKARGGLLTEIEKKSNELMDLKLKNKTLTDDYESFKRDYGIIMNKYNEEKAQRETLELKLASLRTQLDLIVKEKEDAANQYQKKIGILQEKFGDNSSIDLTVEDSNIKAQNLLEFINVSINDFKDLFERKIQNVCMFINDAKEDSLKTEKKFSDIGREKDKNVLETIERIKVSFHDEGIKNKVCHDQEKSLKVNERFEWQKKQIAELMPFKIKSSNLELQTKKLEDMIKANEQIGEVNKQKAEIFEKLNEEKTGALERQKKYIEGLEARGGDVKDFIFRTFPDKLEEFRKWYQY